MTDDIEYSTVSCPRCWQTTVTRSCDYCDDGIVDDLHEQDPMWYDPDDWEYCSHCGGKGYYHWCRNCGWDLIEGRFLNQSNKPPKEFAQRQPFTYTLLESRPGSRKESLRSIAQ